MEKKYKIYIFIIGILIISITTILVSINKRTYYIVLDGENPVIIYEGTEYKEPGYSAFDSYGQNVTGRVKQNSNLDYKHEGEYKIVYTIENKTEITRNIIVKETIPEDLEVEFYLNGSKVKDIKRDTMYKDEGFVALGNNNKDYSKYVTIIGNVNISKVGTYQITYNLNVGNVQKKLSRTINVTGEKYTLLVDSNYYTNKNVIVTIQNNMKEFNYFINPVGSEIKEERVDFSISNNGLYEFYIVDNLKNREKIEVEIKNIDKEAPSVLCEAKVSLKNKTYTLHAEDTSGIAKYVYGGKEYTDAMFTVLNNNEDDEVIVYDNAGNFTKSTCEYIKIKQNGNIIANYNSDTLNYWIEKPNSTYTITHIWVKDVYSQFKTAVNEKIGTLETAKTILNRELLNNNYNNKGMIAINASAFVMTLNNPLIKYNKAWKYSSDAPIIIVDGGIIRDFTNQVLPTTLYPIFGIKNNGYLTYYNIKGGKAVIDENKSTLERMESEGINYTFSFNPILVLNNESKVNMNSKNIRQGLCQIDRNNYVIITNINPTNKRILGLSFKEMAEKMVNLGCKTGVNLDGGGSVSLYYKTSLKDLKTVKSSNRKIADVLYFVEK